MKCFAMAVACMGTFHVDGLCCALEKSGVTDGWPFLHISLFIAYVGDNRRGTFNRTRPRLHGWENARLSERKRRNVAYLGVNALEVSCLIPMQHQHPKDDAAAVTFSSAITADETCGREAPKARGNKSSSSSKYEAADVEGQSTAVIGNSSKADANADNDGSDSDSDEFHDSESDANSHYTVVKKSTFKEPKRGNSGGGLLSRLKDASSLRGSSSMRNKYLPTIESEGGAVSIVTPQHRSRRRKGADDAPQIVISTPACGDEELQEAPAPAAEAEPYEDDGAGITVAIDNAADDEAVVRAAEDEATAAAARQQRQADDDDTHYGDGPQVVIHSCESDSDSAGGFATLNPVINSNMSSSKKYRTSTVSLASMTSVLSKSASTSAQPCLQEIPAALAATDAAAAHGGAHSDAHTLLLVINALGASALAKVEKFGTQSTFLELRVYDSHGSSSSSSDAAMGSGGGSALRTALHKKGGSDAQWNQQFTTPLRSKHKQMLHIAVKTSSKVVIGEASVSLVGVDDGSDGLFYDQHYTIFRPMTTSSTGGGDDADAGDEAASGLVHLQLKIVDAVSAPSSHATTLVPRLQLPPSLCGYDHHSTVSNQPELPAALKNGALLFKVPYHSRSIGSAVIRRQWVMVIPSTSGHVGLEITWCDPTASTTDRKSASRSLDLRLVTEVREGHRTKAFERQLQQSASSSSVVHERDKCFSLVTKARTLDLVASCKEEARIWVSALRELLFSQSSAHSSTDVDTSVMESYRTSALSPRSSSHTSQEFNKPQAFSTTNSKAKLAAWRNVIFDLVRKNRILEVASCLQDGCPIDLLEPGDGDTILMIACRLGHVQLVELCLSWRAKNDPHPEFGETALQAAVNSSHADCVTLLLSTAAKSDMDSEIVNHIDSNNDAPLHVAARHGDLACLQLLLHHGADICVVEEFGRTPLHCAVAHGHLDCVAYLLDVGGDSVLNAGDHDGDTALHYAALAGNEAIVKLLLESAANVFSANAQNETPYDIALREKQQQSAFLISQYYLTNTKEPREVVASPASRNEAASTLLLRQRKLEFEDEDDGEDEAGDHGQSLYLDDNELEYGSDLDASTAYAASHSLQHSGYERISHLQSAAALPPKYIVGHEFEDQDGPQEYGRGYDDPPSSSSRDHHHQYIASLATSRLPLSPSAQVREALLRNQSLRRDAPPSPDVRYYNNSRPVHQQPRYLNPEPGPQRPLMYYSAREASLSYSPVNSSRGAFTERLDCDHHHHSQHQHRGLDQSRSLQFQYAIQRGAVHELHQYEDSESHVYPHASRLPQHADHHHAPAGRHRSHSDEMRYGSPQPRQQQQQYQQQAAEWRRWDGSHSDSIPLQYTQGARRSNSVDLTMSRSHVNMNTPAVRTGWESESPRPHSVQSEQSYQQQVQQTASAAAGMMNPLWETFYTQDGYAYYVHRVTGISQWEQPTALSLIPTPAKALMQISQSNGLDAMLSPDSIIRMRLAEARRNQMSSSSLNGSATVLSALVSSTHTQESTAPAIYEPVVHHEDPTPSPAQPPQATANSELDTYAQHHRRHTDQVLPLSPAPEATPVVSPPASPRRESKFEARTGLQLSVDISSPTRHDGTCHLYPQFDCVYANKICWCCLAETRPVFVPSPRARSPKKSANEPLDSPIREFEGSFQKVLAASS